jgi:4-hydroxy-3-methylbut-2-enyl diphosphate reductase IspH
MAKKAVGTMRTGVGKNFSRVIKMVKSKETGAYYFKEEIVHNDHVNEFLTRKEDE